MNSNEKIVIKAIDYIFDNLEEKINVEDIAKHCSISKYHFNRVFRGVVGESIYSFVKRVRVEKSAFTMRSNPEMNITNIGLKYNLSSSNFSTWFKNYYECSPIKFKKEVLDGKLTAESKYYSSGAEERGLDYYNTQIETVIIEDMRVLYKRFMGSYMEAHENKLSFYNRVREVLKEDLECFEIYYDDPVLSMNDKFIYDCCVCTQKEIQGYESKIISGGKYAKYHFQGEEYEIFSAYQGVLGVWVPQQNIEINENYILTMRGGKIKGDKISMDICIPLK